MGIQSPTESDFAVDQQRTNPISRTMVRGVVLAAAVALLSGGLAGAATAAPGDDSTDSTQARVVVSGAILLSALTEDFSLTGLPGTTVSSNGAVTFLVTTNNLTGYSVTVQSRSSTLDPQDAGNTDVIPIGNLRVRESADTPGAFTNLSGTSSVTVHSQTVRSAPAGDALSNDYQVDIPFVSEDTYVATLDYVATAA